jgi:hypothetical protein
MVGCFLAFTRVRLIDRLQSTRFLYFFVLDDLPYLPCLQRLIPFLRHLWALFFCSGALLALLFWWLSYSSEIRLTFSSLSPYQLQHPSALPVIPNGHLGALSPDLSDLTDGIASQLNGLSMVQNRPQNGLGPEIHDSGFSP